MKTTRYFLTRPGSSLHSLLQIQSKASESSLELLRLFQTLGQRLRHALISSNDLQVWETIDRHGQSVWHAYDPKTGRSATYPSEAEMRIWIEAHYYNQSDSNSDSLYPNSYPILSIR